MHDEYNEAFRAAAAAAPMVTAGQLGRKTGQGFYSY